MISAFIVPIFRSIHSAEGEGWARSYGEFAVRLRNGAARQHRKCGFPANRSM